MVARLRDKPGGDGIVVTIGDFAEVPVEGGYRLIYVVFNTLFNLLTQDRQVRCFENVAAHLAEDGVVRVEAFVPSFLTRLHDDQYVHAEAVEIDEVRLDVARHDPVTQLLDESHVSLTSSGVRLSPIVTRYAWPSELDLMAQIAGLRLIERFGGWQRASRSPPPAATTCPCTAAEAPVRRSAHGIRRRTGRASAGSAAAVSVRSRSRR